MTSQFELQLLRLAGGVNDVFKIASFPLCLHYPLLKAWSEIHMMVKW
jgi:hypothetical protein